MARGRLISLWGPESEVRLRFARELADEASRSGKLTLLTQASRSEDSPSAELIVQRFASLSPEMLRQYLASASSAWGELELNSILNKNVMDSLITLLRVTYDLVLASSAEVPTMRSASLLDRSDSLIWVEREGDPEKKLFEEFLKQLTTLHYPHALVHCVVLPDPRQRPAVYQSAVQNTLRTIDAVPDTVHADSAAVSEALVRQVKEQVQPDLLRVIEAGPAGLAQKAKEAVEACIAKDQSLPSSLDERHQLLDRVLQDVLGLGPIEPLLADPEVTEVMVSGCASIYVEKQGQLLATASRFASESQLRTVIDRIVAPLGRRADESSPLCDARLQDGSRVNIVLPPLAIDGPALTIRKFSARAMTLQHLVQRNALSDEMAQYLTRAVQERLNIVVTGGTGSGKTTFLNALSGLIPERERIVTIEDAAELRLQKPHVVRLESRPPNAEGAGAIPIRRLVMNALRMRPDRIIVGECRGGEALDMLQAMNTGHDGSMTSLHANSPRDALGRLETLVLLAGLELPIRVVREQIRSGVQLLVHIARLMDGQRRVLSITEISGMEGDVITTQELFRFMKNRFEFTGHSPAGIRA